MKKQIGVALGLTASAVLWCVHSQRDVGKVHQEMTSVVWKTAAPVISQDEEKKNEASQDEPQTPAEKIATWTAAFAEEVKAFQTAMRDAKTTEEREAAQKLVPQIEPYLVKILGVADENPGTEVALKALIWVAQNGRGGPEGAKAIRRVVDEFPAAPELASIVGALAMGRFDITTESTLEKLIDNSPHDAVKGQATYALANYIKRQIDTWQRVADNANMKTAMARQYGDAGMAYIEKLAADPQRIETLFETVGEKYGDIAMGQRTLGDIAKANLFEIRFLSIGKVAPDIEGTDLDEVAFKLSDYRGKVVVIDFWGDW